MEYRLGVDRVAVSGDDTDFPYPIKLEYDDEYIYLTLLKMPEWKDLLKLARNTRPEPCDPDNISGELINDYWPFFPTHPQPTEIWLCVETLETSRGQNGNRLYVRDWEEWAVGKKRRFKVVNNNSSDNKIKNPVIGETYAIPINSCKTHMQCSRLLEKTNVYMVVRGTLRIGWWDVDTEFWNAMRTGIYSNRAKIYYNKS